MDPDLDPSTPLRVVYEVPAEGWSQWVGAVKFGDEGHVAVSITTVVNLVRHGCNDHSHADPPVGPTVDDLATALADLAPFRVTSPLKDVTAYGYNGRHLELTVPNLPVEGPETTAASSDASAGISRAGSRLSTQHRGTRSTATRSLATPKSSGSSTLKAPGW